MAADEKALQEKIKRKQNDLERNKKRLASLQHVRPAFMDEYEKLEGDLQKQYEVYLERFRNLDYLEHELGELDRAEKEKIEEAERSLKRMQKRLRDEELKILRGEQGTGRHNQGNSNGDSDMDGGNKSMFGSRTNRMNGDMGGRKTVRGGMTGGESETSSEDMSDEDLTNDSGESDSEEDGSIGGSSGSDESNLIENDDSDSSDEDGGQGDYDYGSGGDSDDAF